MSDLLLNGVNPQVTVGFPGTAIGVVRQLLEGMSPQLGEKDSPISGGSRGFVNHGGQEVLETDFALTAPAFQQTLE